MAAATLTAAVSAALAGPTLPASADPSVSVEALVSSRAEVQKLLGPLPTDEAGRSGYRADVALEGMAPVGWSADPLDKVDVDVTLVTGGPGADGSPVTPSLGLTWRLRDCDAEGVCDEGHEVLRVSDAVAALDAVQLTVRPARLRVTGTIPAGLLVPSEGLPADVASGVQVDLDLPLPKSLRAKTSAVVTGDVVLTTSDDGAALTWQASRSAQVDLPERVQRVATLWADSATATVTRSWAGTIDRPLTLPTLGGQRASALAQSMRFDAATVSGQVELTTDEPVLTDDGVPLLGTRQVSRMGVMLAADAGGAWSSGAAFRAGLRHLDCTGEDCVEVGPGEDGAGVAPTATSDAEHVQLSVGTQTPTGLVTSVVDVDLGEVAPTLTVSAVHLPDGGWRWTSRLTLVAAQGTYSGTINGTPATVRVLQPLTWKADVDTWRTVSRDGPSLPGATAS
ncbi:MAG: hypothetical protein U0Q15_08860 [Kineosporiaceae bacterium]